MKTFPFETEKNCSTCGKLTDTQNRTSECTNCFLTKTKELQGDE